MKSLMKYSPRLLWIVLLLTISLCAFSQEKKEEESKQEAPLTVDEIIKKANHASYYQGKDGRSNVKMVITDNQGRTREREFTILRRNQDEKDEEQKYYVYFDSPADVRKMVFMVWKHLDKDDDRWLYLPALDLVKRIAASDKRTSFVGSHFYYEDVSGRSLSEDTHTLEATDEKYHVIQNVPKDPKSVEFASFKVWIDKNTFLPMKAEYLDKNGKKYREMEVLEVQTISDFPTVTKSKISDLETGGNTLMTFSEIKYGIGLPEDIFTERYLRNAPRKWLK
jgi:hypothetical protein